MSSTCTAYSTPRPSQMKEIMIFLNFSFDIRQESRVGFCFYCFAYFSVKVKIYAIMMSKAHRKGKKLLMLLLPLPCVRTALSF